MRRYTIGAAILSLLLTSTARAQEPTIAVTGAYPYAAGLLWQVRERVALRPEFTFGYSSEADDLSLVMASGWRFGFGTSAIVSIIRDTPRHLYVAPYYEFQRRNTALSQPISYSDPDTFNVVNLLTLEVNARSYEHSMGGLAGFEFRLNNRYAFFAEAGAAYRHSRRSASPVPPVPDNSSPVAFSDESLNRNANDVRAIARVGMNVYF